MQPSPKACRFAIGPPRRDRSGRAGVTREALPWTFQPPETQPNGTRDLLRKAVRWSSQARASTRKRNKTGLVRNLQPASHRGPHLRLRDPMYPIRAGDAAPEFGDGGQNGNLVPFEAGATRITPAHPDTNVVQTGGTV
jgi:hypothetical protein